MALFRALLFTNLVDFAAASLLRNDRPCTKGCARPRTFTDLASLPAFVINLDRRADRWEAVQANLQEHLQIVAERVVGVDGDALDASLLDLAEPDPAQGPKHEVGLTTPGAVGCYLSHTKAWQSLLDSGAQYGLILEDDSYFHDNSAREFDAAIQEVNAAGPWSMLQLGQLGGQPAASTEPVGSHAQRITGRFLGAHAYVMSRQFAEKALQEAFPMRYHVDQYLGIEAAKRPELGAYVAPGVARQLLMGSDIHPGFRLPDLSSVVVEQGHAAAEALLQVSDGQNGMYGMGMYDSAGMRMVGGVSLDATVRMRPHGMYGQGVYPTTPVQFGVKFTAGALEIGHSEYIEDPTPAPTPLPGAGLENGLTTAAEAPAYVTPWLDGSPASSDRTPDGQFPPHLPHVALLTGDAGARTVTVLGSTHYHKIEFAHQGTDIGADDGSVSGAGAGERPTVGDLVVSLTHEGNPRGRIIQDDHDSMPYQVQWEDGVSRGTYHRESNVRKVVQAFPHAFGRRDLHRLYTVSALEKQKAVATSEVYFSTGKMCGVSPFSTPELTCSAVSPSLVPYAQLDDAVPQRAFGIELEMVARSTDNLSAEFDALLQKKQNLGKLEAGAHSGLSNNLRKVAQCWDLAKVRHPDAPAQCAQHADCALAMYCRTDGTCRPRNKCEAEASIDGVCPHLMGSWRWETDCTVHPLNSGQAREIHGDNEAAIASETSGVPFEMVSALPPNALAGASGVKSVAEVLTTLRHMGVQAGPTQGMHMHVNVGKPGKESDTDDARAGADLTVEQVANIWANYAKYQNVIDEMLQDSRMGNTWAKPLRFASWRSMLWTDENDSSWQHDTANGQSVDYSRTALKTFTKLWRWVQQKKRKEDQDDTKFCDFVLGRYEGATPCSDRYPQERYSHVNLAVLNKYGTIEFRAFPASSDPRRVTEWVQFLLRFVEHFKDDGRWHLHGAGQELDHPTLEQRVEALEAKVEQLETNPKDADAFAADFERLAEQQRTASLADLEEALGADLSYWRERPWLTGAPCKMPCGDECKKNIDDFEKQAEDDKKELEVSPPSVSIESDGQPDTPLVKSGSYNPADAPAELDSPMPTPAPTPPSPAPTQMPTADTHSPMSLAETAQVRRETVKIVVPHTG